MEAREQGKEEGQQSILARPNKPPRHEQRRRDEEGFRSDFLHRYGFAVTEVRREFYRRDTKSAEKEKRELPLRSSCRCGLFGLQCFVHWHGVAILRIATKTGLLPGSAWILLPCVLI